MANFDDYQPQKTNMYKAIQMVEGIKTAYQQMNDVINNYAEYSLATNPELVLIADAMYDPAEIADIDGASTHLATAVAALNTYYSLLVNA